ncbi:DUF1192 domain-containing protein [Sphingosinicella sp.]|uniref:DUF1192 domain-containing protein n=1 Tax=Sphingosinicella sp. TaxID=1917971 RepID=UPI0017BA36CB|nr:DUF1192 domain-containing protein [Sphingosinicella sp.]MBA4759849.1 DUF1192 domain-containing protein [Sphingosinicella sp.]
MDDDFLPKTKDDPLTLFTRQDLDPLSQDELRARIAALEAEIGRTRAKLTAAGSVKSAADALFARK